MEEMGTRPDYVARPELVNGPGKALLVLGIACIALGLADAGWKGFMATGDPYQMWIDLGVDPDIASTLSAGGGFGGVIGVLWALVVEVAVGVLILLGARKMLALESWAMAIVASIVAMVPCITPCCLCVAGLPIGIWSLVTLMKPEVKQAFGA